MDVQPDGLLLDCLGFQVSRDMVLILKILFKREKPGNGVGSGTFDSRKSEEHFHGRI
jgi:hypothetical protein